jgi:hypothetical protein
MRQRATVSGRGTGANATHRNVMNTTGACLDTVAHWASAESPEAEFGNTERRGIRHDF